MEALGFRIAPTDDPNALQLRLEFNPNIMNMRVSAALWQNGVPIVAADAANSGWGTALARGTALNNLVDSAAAQFDAQLQKISARIRIVDDSPRETIAVVPAGEVTIESNVPNADVYIDGKFVGSAPLNGYRLPVGEHQIKVVSEGHGDWHRTLTIFGGTATRVAATLSRSKP